MASNQYMSKEELLAEAQAIIARLQPERLRKVQENVLRRTPRRAMKEVPHRYSCTLCGATYTVMREVEVVSSLVDDYPRGEVRISVRKCHLCKERLQSLSKEELLDLLLKEGR